MRIAYAQINPTLGDLKENKNKIIEYIEKAKMRNCDILIFPEAALLGYHPFDLLEQRALVKKQIHILKEIERKLPNELIVIIGVFTFNKSKRGKPYFNSIAVLEKRKRTRFFHKELLPTGDVFDEARFIESGKISDNVISLKGRRTLLTICEDIWAWEDTRGYSNYKANPLKLIKGKFDLVINLSASPYYHKKIMKRKMLVAKTAKLFNATMIYVNLVGAQDEIIFDGESFVVNKAGKLLSKSLKFEEDFNLFDLETEEGGFRNQKLNEIEEIRAAIILGIRDFCQKIGIQKVHLGLSGGIDSAIVAALAVEALGANSVTGIYLPTKFNSSDSGSLAGDLAKNLGITFIQFPIEEIYQKTLLDINNIFNNIEFSLMNENLQARIRGLLLMAYSNLNNSLLLSTSNKTEFACGYATLYGDMCGGLAPIGDLVKEKVYQLANLYNQEHELIPRKIIDRAPSAELKPNQKDQDTLPEYNVLDKAVKNLIENSLQPKGSVEKWLIQAVLKNEFKRWQAPPILKVTKHSFGRGRRYPIANRAIEYIK